MTLHGAGMISTRKGRRCRKLCHPTTFIIAYKPPSSAVLDFIEGTFVSCMRNIYACLAVTIVSPGGGAATFPQCLCGLPERPADESVETENGSYQMDLTT